ncbi:hypothetical protein ADK86_34365 [Streptomyces sp. NRRL F-5755]|uniref:hypothetical protein n=1 Tax=Streptomyces sp. NRRL F-5755 TaxID=1519475 RepID=UPI0006ADDB17|nr:hypothetical protein [Streptomyces sp. NRRL F-5755]KOT87763.1 hypothetical protein ADK86_34365 [Streptomyces sp. NRRL F-5755]
MSSIRRAAACAATAIGIGLTGAVVTAPPAFAGSGHYISFENKGWFVVNTCYKWTGSKTSDSCDSGKKINDTWRVEIPEDATGVELNVNVLAQVGGGNITPQIDDLKRDHCYEFSGYTWGPKLTPKNC